MPKKKPTKGKPKVHKDLEGFEININEFGELITNTNVEDLNKFLNKNVDDKKLRDRDDLKEQWEEEWADEDENADEEEEVSNEDVNPDDLDDIDDEDLENLKAKDGE